MATAASGRRALRLASSRLASSREVKVNCRSRSWELGPKSRVASRSFSLTPLWRFPESSSSQGGKSSSSQWPWGLAAFSALAVAAASGLYFGASRKDSIVREAHKAGKGEKLDAAYYQRVYNAIAESLEEGAEEYDDGSYAPVLIRLAWHASGTFDKTTGNGGSNGATMRFAPEADHGANAGLLNARNKLEPIKQKFPAISYSDLWTLAGVVAVQEMGGPHVKWRPGRQDGLVENCTPDGRLPDADKGAPHIRDIFYRMGFNDQEIVALSGAHAVGRCHTDRSGFDGPWTHSPVSFTNEYFRLLFDEKWQARKWKGPPQFEDVKTKGLMMLRTDMALVTDKAFRPIAELYAKSQERFFEDFAKAFGKLIELGVPAANLAGQDYLTLKATGE